MRGSPCCLLVAVALLVSACADDKPPAGRGPTAGPTAPGVAQVARLAPGAHDLVVGGEAATVLVPEHPNGRLVVYVHGFDGRAGAVLSDDRVGGLAAGLVAEGYAVASSDAAGNAWGDDASVDDYATLAATVSAGTGATDVFLLAESMGGLAAARLVHERRIGELRAYAGIYPLCDLSSVYDDFRESVDGAYGPAVPEALDRLSPVALDGAVPVLFWASPEDVTVDKERNADVCAAQVVADGGSAVVVETDGRHLDASNFRLDALLRFFESAAG